MPYTTKTSTKWFLKIRDSVPGLKTTIRGDGAYDGDYQLIKKVWLIDRKGERKDYTTFDEFWLELAPSPDDIDRALANPDAEFLHLLHCGLDCGRPISRHTLWDQMDDVADYRDPVIEDGILSFYVYECGDAFSPPWRHIERIRFNIAYGTFSREHVVDF